MVKLSTKEHKEAKYQTTWNQRWVLDPRHITHIPQSWSQNLLKFNTKFPDLNDQQTQAASHTASRLYIHHSQVVYLPSHPCQKLSPQPDLPSLGWDGVVFGSSASSLGHHQGVSVSLCERSLVPSRHPQSHQTNVNTRPYISTWYPAFCVCLDAPWDSSLPLLHLPSQTSSTHLPDAPAQIHFNHVTALFKNLQCIPHPTKSKLLGFQSVGKIVPNPTHMTVLSTAPLVCV